MDREAEEARVKQEAVKKALEVTGEEGMTSSHRRRDVMRLTPSCNYSLAKHCRL